MLFIADILVTSDELTEAIQQYRALGLTTEKFDHKQGETAGELLCFLNCQESRRFWLEVLLSLDSAFDGPSSSHAPLPHAPARLPQPPKEDVLSLLDEVFSASNVALPPVIPYLLSSSTSVSKSSSSTSLPLQNEAGNSALSKGTVSYLRFYFKLPRSSACTCHACALHLLIRNFACCITCCWFSLLVLQICR